MQQAHLHQIEMLIIEVNRHLDAYLNCYTWKSGEGVVSSLPIHLNELTAERISNVLAVREQLSALARNVRERQEEITACDNPRSRRSFLNWLLSARAANKRSGKNAHVINSFHQDAKSACVKREKTYSPTHPQLTEEQKRNDADLQECINKIRGILERGSVENNALGHDYRGLVSHVVFSNPLKMTFCQSPVVQMFEKALADVGRFEAVVIQTPKDQRSLL